MSAIFSTTYNGNAVQRRAVGVEHEPLEAAGTSQRQAVAQFRRCIDQRGLQQPLLGHMREPAVTVFREEDLARQFVLFEQRARRKGQVRPAQAQHLVDFHVRSRVRASIPPGLGPVAGSDVACTGHAAFSWSERCLKFLATGAVVQAITTTRGGPRTQALPLCTHHKAKRPQLVAEGVLGLSYWVLKSLL